MNEIGQLIDSLGVELRATVIKTAVLQMAIKKVPSAWRLGFLAKILDNLEFLAKTRSWIS